MKKNETRPLLGNARGIRSRMHPFFYKTFFLILLWCSEDIKRNDTTRVSSSVLSKKRRTSTVSDVECAFVVCHDGTTPRKGTNKTATDAVLQRETASTPPQHFFRHKQEKWPRISVCIHMCFVAIEANRFVWRKYVSSSSWSSSLLLSTKKNQQSEAALWPGHLSSVTAANLCS